MPIATVSGRGPAASAMAGQLFRPFAFPINASTCLGGSRFHPAFKEEASFIPFRRSPERLNGNGQCPRAKAIPFLREWLQKDCSGLVRSYREAMPKPLFRIKPYKNSKYKFVVRGKIDGKWTRRYFISEAEAKAFAKEQNSALDDAPRRQAPSRGQASGRRQQSSVIEWADVTAPAYLGPKIQRYLGDSWCMHLPFAYDLMRAFAPKVFVELGVKQGESYFTFCQSAAENHINVRCYGIDSWKGDVQTGPLDARIYDEVVEYNWQYSSF